MSELVDITTGEIVDGLTAVEARELTDRIRGTLTVAHDLIVQAYQGRAWTALGYGCWDAYCSGEFGEARMVRLDREQRREIVAEMRQAGMSTRAIATGLGVDRKTVMEDVQQVVRTGPPAPVIGLDGKTYEPTPAPRPAPKGAAEPKPRTDVVAAINTTCVRARDAAMAARLINPQHLRSRSEEAAVWLRDLSHSLEVLNGLAAALQEATQ